MTHGEISRSKWLVIATALTLTLAVFALPLAAITALSRGTLAFRDDAQSRSNILAGGAQAVQARLVKLGKDAAGGKTETPLKGAGFQLYRAGEGGNDDLIGEYVTDGDGLIDLPVLTKPGNYYFLETMPPEGYGLDRDIAGRDRARYDFDTTGLHGSGETLTLTVYNRQLIGGLVIEKIVRNADGSPLTEEQKAAVFAFKVTFSNGMSYPCVVYENGEPVGYFGFPAPKDGGSGEPEPETTGAAANTEDGSPTVPTTVSAIESGSEADKPDGSNGTEGTTSDGSGAVTEPEGTTGVGIDATTDVGIGTEAGIDAETIAGSSQTDGAETSAPDVPSGTPGAPEAPEPTETTETLETTEPGGQEPSEPPKSEKPEKSTELEELPGPNGTIGKEAPPYASGSALSLRHGQTAVFSALPVGLGYTVAEETSEGYWTTGDGHVGTITEDGALATFVNTTGDGDAQTVTISGSKTWDMSKAPAGTPLPSSIIIYVRNGGIIEKVITVTAEDGWRWSATLPRYDAHGKEITYAISEASIPGYRASITGYDITNRRLPETTVPSKPKPPGIGAIPPPKPTAPDSPNPGTPSKGTVEQPVSPGSVEPNRPSGSNPPDGSSNTTEDVPPEPVPGSPAVGGTNPDPGAPRPAPGSRPMPGGVPKTGDSAMPELWLILFVASALGLSILGRPARKAKKQRRNG